MALKDKVKQAASTQGLARPASTVMSIFQDARIKAQLAAALPAGGLTADRLLVVALNEIRRNPKLLDCTRESFVGALLYAAHLGLEVGGALGHFYLVPFRNTQKKVVEITPILGYKGMIVLARRSGEISDIAARAVYSMDVFDWSYGLEDRLVHKPAMGDRGTVVAFYGVARFVNGGHQFLVMSKADVDKYRARSKADQAGSSPWQTDYEPMGAKTVVRRMAAFLPLTTEAASAIAEDEERELGLTPEGLLDLEAMGFDANGHQAKDPPASKEAAKSEPPAGGAGAAMPSTEGAAAPEAGRDAGAPLATTAGDPTKDPAAPGSILRDPGLPLEGGS